MTELKNPGPIEFEAVIQSSSGGGAWVDFPLPLKETFGKGNLVPVNATFEGIESYQGYLSMMGGDCAMLLVKKEIREKLGKKPGDRLHVRVEVETKPRQAEVPKDLQAALNQSAQAKEAFTALSLSHQNEYIRWIEEAKRPETRQNRIKKSVEMLLEKKKLS